MSAPHFTLDTDRWQAILNRSFDADGRFVYGVITTGIYCRPTCAARRPKPENIRYFETYQIAEAAGFRACKRCQPNATAPQSQQIEKITQICHLIATSETPPSLAEMANLAGLSPYHFHRVFKRVLGVTPKAYVKAQRTKRLQVELQEQPSVTEAIYEAGFASSSQVYAQANTLLGMTPKNYRQGARGQAIRYTIQRSQLGWVLIAATQRGICAIHLGESEASLVQQLQKQFPQAQLADKDEQFNEWVRQVLALIEAPQHPSTLPLDIQGTAFQAQVWQALQTIPAGHTVTYTEIAEQIGKPTAVRAVARAIATNSLAIAIPCHRVIGRDGGLKGYRWGSDLKRALLDREAQATQRD
ncbi:MAG TPA: bifunctional DNA-binding transcriptional regulator/O6-methylguanine-DNA methyltransferase Ada [Leptolyngbyaceae cyanobacterium M33_DOE_097]|uniref:methylated-DNA--[protein]-cysteine S-methyltransferase n=1 Tax=Oscillatoriales cyanobacterium SpSt-418 TaxID=2282169 RepID=A0A7C3PFW8_9CYAN|nr:bifunctional DNA-binding transcriptional regulator/O6-methylguanine-DNA methyltransferase Ada [Leptolyngbyaceae cyanobacterium M33_DOE_097]